jgi:Rad3-related DNA helicase
MIGHFPERMRGRRVQPRAEQIEALERIHQALEVEGKRYFVLDAPTGVGKSGIGAAVASYYGNAFITSPQNNLVDQYKESFPEMHVVKGKANYRCRNFPFGPPLFKVQTSETGLELRDCETAEDLDKERHDEVCADYRPAMHAFWRGPRSVTNLDFLFWAHCPKNIDGLEHRRILIVDECHNLEEKLVGLGKVRVTPYQCNRVGYDFSQFGGTKPEQAERALREFQKCIAQASYKDAKEERSYQSKRDMISVALDSGDWIHWIDKETGNFVVCPMSAREQAKKLFSMAGKILFMSATVGNVPIFLEGLGIPKERAGFLYVDSPFPPENRMLEYLPVGNMSQAHYAQSLPYMIESCGSLLRDDHPKDKGLIICVSEKLQKDLERGLRPEFGDRLIVHGSREQTKVIERHCNGEKPTVLIGFGMMEGIDLSDDHARFLVFPKVPFPFLGDHYIKERQRRSDSWYAWQTALTITQGCGRVVRSATDHSKIYMLDACFGRFIQTHEAQFPPWFLDAIEIGHSSGAVGIGKRRPHSVTRTKSRRVGVTVKASMRHAGPKGTSRSLTGKYVAQIRYNGKVHGLGTFSTEGEAGHAYSLVAEALLDCATPEEGLNTITSMSAAWKKSRRGRGQAHSQAKDGRRTK